MNINNSEQKTGCVLTSNKYPILFNNLEGLHFCSSGDLTFVHFIVMFVINEHNKKANRL